MLPILINALRETLYMVLYASLFSILLGIPFGIIIANLFTSQSGPQRFSFHVFYSLLKVVKALPYVIVMLLFIPLTNFLINNQITYTTATIVPLTIAGSLLIAQAVFEVVVSIKSKWQSTTKAMGATNRQILWYILMPESFRPILEACAETAATIVSFSIIAGAFGAGGLGQFAIEKTITDPNILYAAMSIMMLILIQQIFRYSAILIFPQKQ